MKIKVYNMNHCDSIELWVLGLYIWATFWTTEYWSWEWGFTVRHGLIRAIRVEFPSWSLHIAKSAKPSKSA